MNKEKINLLIEKVNWAETTEKERKSFSSSLNTLELSYRNYEQVYAISDNQLNCFIWIFAITSILYFTGIDHQFIIAAILITNVIFHLISKVYEKSSGAFCKQMENNVESMLIKLIEKNPAPVDSGDDKIV